MFAMEQSWTETSFLEKVRAHPSSLSRYARSLVKSIGDNTILARH